MTDTRSVEADLWHVEVASGEVLVVTLDQLDDAFDRGQVNGQTRVWQEGMPAAVPLAELLGLDEDDGAVHAPQLAAPPAPKALPSVAPPPSNSAGAWQANALPSVAPPPSNSAGAWQANALPSVVPTAFDIEDDEVPFARPRRRSALAIGFVSVIAAAAGAILYASTSGGSSTASAAVAPAPILATPPASRALDVGDAPLHLHEAAPTSGLGRDAPSGASAATSPTEEPLSLRDAMLKNAGAKKASHPASHSRVAGLKASRRHGHGGTASFKATKGGSKYDPLNGSL